MTSVFEMPVRYSSREVSRQLVIGMCSLEKGLGWREKFGRQQQRWY